MASGSVISTVVKAAAKNVSYPAVEGDRDATKNVRAFAHCHNSDSSVAVVTVNFDPENAVNVALPSLYAAAQRRDWVFTSCSDEGGLRGDCVQLNGAKVMTLLPAGTLPPLQPNTVSAEQTLTLPPVSYAFSLLPAPDGVCT